MIALDYILFFNENPNWDIFTCSFALGNRSPPPLSFTFSSFSSRFSSRLIPPHTYVQPCSQPRPGPFFILIPDKALSNSL